MECQNHPVDTEADQIRQIIKEAEQDVQNYNRRFVGYGSVPQDSSSREKRSKNA